MIICFPVVAAAAAICGVADEVPAPCKDTLSVVPNCAHGILGEYAETAVFIKARGPKLPCISVSCVPQALLHGRWSNVTPQAATTLLNLLVQEIRDLRTLLSAVVLVICMLKYV
jgi:hypothetical protein